MKALLLVTLLLLSACTTGQATGALGRPLSCSDTDGGIEFGSAGVVTAKMNEDSTRMFTDTCDDKVLTEYYCDAGNFVRTETIECNCLYGVCQ